MQCYLMDLGFQAPDMSVWRRGDFVIKLNWGDPSTGTHVSNRLKMAMCEDRWQRVANQESAAGVEQGVDWTVPSKRLKQAAKRPYWWHPDFACSVKVLFAGRGTVGTFCAPGVVPKIRFVMFCMTVPGGQFLISARTLLGRTSIRNLLCVFRSVACSQTGHFTSGPNTCADGHAISRSLQE